MALFMCFILCVCVHERLEFIQSAIHYTGNELSTKWHCRPNEQTKKRERERKRVRLSHKVFWKQTHKAKYGWAHSSLCADVRSAENNFQRKAMPMDCCSSLHSNARCHHVGSCYSQFQFILYEQLNGSTQPDSKVYTIYSTAMRGWQTIFFQSSTCQRNQKYIFFRQISRFCEWHNTN